MIHVHELTKIFNKYNRIENISFTVKKGKCFALCGENGTGKSTIIKMITGIMKPTSGEVILNGCKVGKDNEYKKQFSFMPDHLLFSNMLTGYEVLLFFAELRNIEKEKVDELLKAVGLYEERHKKMKYYSKGMQQRLALAHALLPNAPILILDEPTNGLDPYWVYRFKEMMMEQKRNGTTILFSTHILSIIEEIADQAAFIHRGNMFVCDSVADLRQQNKSLERVFFNMFTDSSSTSKQSAGGRGL
ncbi:ABC-2 type transport system ATP-binding protein [Anoxybacillus vitaminiphilus]|uniref:ABC-2 type transport system ATP-binding protein n=1 Tax=Paranoxybacillus vitaminiphilus TaxID=581036 RepID=A0A327YBF1_9BACL|nr:ABC transporter ATP-binding protein [Anoxybacillus vitaminiphilus]RAK18400.1 ABC-2 type transport system ATP-binding protein [Anoxybacillus vitaminiphilus]